MTRRELEERLERLEKKLEEMEKRLQMENHCHYYYHYYQPYQYPYYQFPQITGTGTSTDITSSGDSRWLNINPVKE